MFGAKSNPETHACFGKSFVAAQWDAHGVVSKNPIGATKVFSNPMMMMYLTGWEELQGCHAQQEDSRRVTPSH